MNIITLTNNIGQKVLVPVNKIDSVTYLEHETRSIVAIYAGTMNFNVTFETHEEGKRELERIETAILTTKGEKAC